MSLARHSKRRDENEGAIVEALRRAGATVWQIDRPVDLLVGYQGRTLLLEVKRPLGPRGGRRATMRAAQRQFFREWRGGPAEIVTTPEEALELIGR